MPGDAPSPFQHGVASGDPTTDSVIIWARITTDGARPIEVTWTVGGDARGERVVTRGTALATPERDWTVSVDVDGLAAGTSFRYWFEAMGEKSPVGRTRTLPAGDVARLRIAQVSCAKFNAGFFNAYACIAERDDIDFVLHLGDYIYEASQTPPASQTPGADIGRPFDPRHECKTLDDYRRRYAQYRSDPDLQRLHAAHPIIATADDHEFADGAWRGGAAEHREDRDGPWRERLAAAFRAREEWLPMRRPVATDPTRLFRTIAIGDLADLFLLDTRTRRDEPVPPPAMLAPGRSALGTEQRRWLFDGLAESNARWRVVGNPSVMSRTWNDALSETVREALMKVKLIDLDGTGPDYDQWDGYPEEREALMNHLRDNRIANVVVVSGDVHVGMAIELGSEDGAEPVGVEFVNTSITSQNLDDKMGWPPRTESLPIANEFVAGMPHVHWVDFDSHGYSLIDVTPERVTVEWWALETVLERSREERCVGRWIVESGSPHVIPG